MDPNHKKIDIWHAAECKCKIDGQAIYVAEPCLVMGHHVTKRRLAQLRHKITCGVCGYVPRGDGRCPGCGCPADP